MVHNANNELTTINCRGAGRFESQNAEQGVMSAKWIKQMRKYQDPNSELDILELEDGLG